MALFASCFAPAQRANITMDQLLADEKAGGSRIIMVEMTENEINQAVDDFMTINADNHPVRPAIRQNGDRFFLKFPDSTPYGLFCYWVNYIVYSNKDKRYNNNVIGWYEVGADAIGTWKQFAGQNLMFFIPESDSAFDNVFFTTKDNLCFKQEFAFKAKLKPQRKVFKKYVGPIDPIE